MQIDLDLRRGWTLGRVDGLSLHIARTHRNRSLDFDEVRDAARQALLEEIYRSDADGALSDDEAWRIARNGAQRYDYSERREHGLDHEDPSKPKYGAAVYVASQSSPPPPDALIIDRLALIQVWQTLQDLDAETIVAWASFDTREAAAAAVGCKPKTFNARLVNAKRRFLETWYDWETAPSAYARDRRVISSGDQELDRQRAQKRRSAFRNRRRAA